MQNRGSRHYRTPRGMQLSRSSLQGCHRRHCATSHLDVFFFLLPAEAGIAQAVPAYTRRALSWVVMANSGKTRSPFPLLAHGGLRSGPFRQITSRLAPRIRSAPVGPDGYTRRPEGDDDRPFAGTLRP